MNAVCRNPSIVSNKVSWAPGWGRSRRTINRVGQARRQVDQVGELDDLGAGTPPAAGFDR